MLQLILTIYGIVALVRGKFSVGRGREVVGTRARILGGICAASLPGAFALGLTIGILAAMGVFPMPEQSQMIFVDLGVVILTVIAVVVLGKRFYRQQEEELELAQPTTTGPATAQYYSVIDPNNPFASPSVKD